MKSSRLHTANFFSSSCEVAKPGQMTDYRSALVNNNLLAALVVNANLHPFLLYHSPELSQKVCGDRCITTYSWTTGSSRNIMTKVKWFSRALKFTKKRIF